MKRDIWFGYTSVVVSVLVGLMLAACVPGAAPAASTAPQSTPAEAVEPAPAAPSEGEIPRGGTVIMGMWEDPGKNLNPYFGFTLHYWMVPALEKLISWDPDGNPYPELATEVPTNENGGVSADGRTITYHLREGVRWADGEVFDCEDVRFTFEAVKNPNNQVGSRLGYTLVDTVECPDPLTAVVNFTEYYAAWMTLPLFVVPEHILGQYESWNEAEWNEKLIGTGPFYVTENVNADHVTFEKNPYYWKEGKPYIDRFIIRYVPSREAGLALFQAGDLDVFFDLTEAELAPLLDQPGMQIYNAKGNAVERLVLNLSTPSDPDHGNPNVPHPVLGDVRVRRAIELAIDKQAIVNDLLAGLAEVATTEYPHGWAADPTLTPSPYEPEQAMQLLEEAGWIDQDGDGVRECRGCETAQEGTRAEITLNTTSLKLRELVGSLIQQNLADVGIQMNFEAQTPTEIWGTWEENGRGAQGTFDIQMWTDYTPVEPQDALFNKFHSSQIPRSATECGACWNWSRLANEEVDRLLDENSSTPDQELRKANFSRIFHIINEQVPSIYLYNRGQISVLRDHVKGYLGPFDTPDPFEYLTSNLEDFYIQR